MSDGDERLNIWVSGCARGDRRSQQKVFESLYGKMLAICMRYAKDADEAKDLLQEGFIKVFKNIDNYNKKGSFEGWVKRIMVNTAIDSFRKNKSNPLHHNDSESLEKVSDTADEIESDEFAFSAKEVVEALQKLTPGYRSVFNLYVVENYTHREIAEKLNISEGTSKSNLAKAKMRIKTILLHREKKDE